jgi:hypothetical protein
LQISRGGDAIYDPVIEYQGQCRHRPCSNLLLDDNRPFGRPTKTKDCTLRWVDDWRKQIDSEAA